MVCLPYAAILVAFALIHVPRATVVAREMAKLDGGYNNREPRAQQAQLSGVGRRALGAHHNAIEAFPPFAIGVLAALARGVSLDVVSYLAIGFVVVRTIYVVAYLADKSALRSGVWTLGTLATAALMITAVAGAPH